MNFSFKFAAVAAIAVSTFASCSKDQSSVNKLAGDWWLTSMTVGGVEMIDTTAGDYPMYHFEKCNLEDRNCNGYSTWTAAGTGLSTTRNFTYEVHEDAANLHLYWAPMLGAQQTEVHCDITTQEKDVFTFTYTDVNGAAVEQTLNRGKALEELTGEDRKSTRLNSSHT